MVIRTAALSFSLLLTVVCSLSAAAQEQLQWKLKPGETLKYQVQQKMDTEIKVDGQTINQVMVQVMDMSWKVSSVSPTGDAKVTQIVDRVQMKLDGGPVGSVQFDTNAKETPSSPAAKMMADVFAKIVGAEFNVTMKSTGRIENVEVPKTLIEAIASSQTGVARALNEDTLKQMMEQSSVVLPPGSVSPGQNWESTQQVKLPFGEMKVASKMTYDGKDSATGLSKILMKPTITVTPAKDAPLQMSLTKSDGVGQVFFDVGNGRISKSELDLTLQMQVSQPGQVIDQTVKQKTTMTLVK